MTAFVALLRAVNVGGRAKVPMADLRDLAGAIGLQDAATILQSGNIVFRSEGSDERALEDLLEHELETRLALDTEVIVRAATAWAEAVAGNPFPDTARDNPSHFLLVSLEAEPKPGAERALRTAVKGREQVMVRGRSAYVTYPDGIGRSPLTNALLERHLGVRGTGRNWNSVLKIARALEG